jgi:hypothetical protein
VAPLRESITVSRETLLQMHKAKKSNLGYL